MHNVYDKKQTRPTRRRDFCTPQACYRSETNEPQGMSGCRLCLSRNPRMKVPMNGPVASQPSSYESVVSPAKRRQASSCSLMTRYNTSREDGVVIYKPTLNATMSSPSREWRTLEGRRFSAFLYTSLRASSSKPLHLVLSTLKSCIGHAVPTTSWFFVMSACLSCATIRRYVLRLRCVVHLVALFS